MTGEGEVEVEGEDDSQVEGEEEVMGEWEGRGGMGRGSINRARKIEWHRVKRKTNGLEQ